MNCKTQKKEAFFQKLMHELMWRAEGREGKGREGKERKRCTLALPGLSSRMHASLSSHMALFTFLSKDAFKASISVSPC